VLDWIRSHYKYRTCFVFSSIDGDDGPCDYFDYMPGFFFIRLVPCRLEDVRDETKEDNCLINNDKEMLATTLNIGEHFAIITIENNIESDGFWILICEETLVMVEEVNKVDYSR
jgi:hypothetical protein